MDSFERKVYLWRLEMDFKFIDRYGYKSFAAHNFELAGWGD